MELDPRQAAIITAMATGICVGLSGYFAYGPIFPSGDSVMIGTDNLWIGSGTQEASGMKLAR